MTPSFGGDAAWAVRFTNGDTVREADALPARFSAQLDGLKSLDESTAQSATVVAGVSNVEAGARRATRPLISASLKSVCFGCFIDLRLQELAKPRPGSVDSARAERPGAARLAAWTAPKVLATEVVVALGVPFHALRTAALLQGMANHILAHTAARAHP